MTLQQALELANIETWFYKRFYKNVLISNVLVIRIDGTDHDLLVNVFDDLPAAMKEKRLQLISMLNRDNLSHLVLINRLNEL